MDDETVIQVDHLNKTFKLPHEKQSSIKGLLTSFGKRSKTYETQKALSNVSFEVKKGEFYGIVGRNGSGKSTLLKLLAGIYTPTKGTIHVNGNVTPFIELGVGFNPELTGRENVFLNGALLGFSRKTMQGMYQKIVDFAEIERFMDQKLKNYSSGMQVRLAFSIAIQAKSDILILDEVLAVGDEAFQQKCVDVFETYKAQKQTVVLVTHDMETVRKFCSRAMLMSDGVVKMIGKPDEIARHYSELNAVAIDAESAHKNDYQTSDLKIKLLNGNNRAVTRFKNGDQLQVELSWPPSLGGVLNAGVSIVKNSGEYNYGTNTFDKPPKHLNGKISYVVGLPLGPGKYHIMAGVFGKDGLDRKIFVERGPEFIIEPEKSPNVQGLFRIKHTWSVSHDKQTEGEL